MLKKEFSLRVSSFINIQSDIQIFLDTHLDKKKLNILKQHHRQHFSQFQVFGFPRLKRGILVLLKKSNGCTISNVTDNGNTDTLKFSLTLPDLTSIDILAVYAPSEDCPNNFWNNVHEYSSTGEAPHRIIVGDFNCTLNHEIDSTGYKTDPHPKSRKVINGILDNEEFVDSYRQ
jgi:hypothetical protein